MAIAAAVIAGVFVPGQPAWAAPDVGAGAEAPEPELDRGPDGLQAPDAASALTIARLEGEKVEVLGERTETSSTWALPDGTMTMGRAVAPVWVRMGDGDGTAAADWAPVDLTLVVTPEGDVAPASYPAELTLAGEGVPEDGSLVTLTNEGGEQISIAWAEELPEPRLEGPRATYEDVQPGVDLVVEVNRTGYEQFFVLTEEPGDPAALDLSLQVRTEGLETVPDEDGGVLFTSTEGEVLGHSGTPLVWDAEVDAERDHPIAEPFVAPEPIEGALNIPGPIGTAAAGISAVAYAAQGNKSKAIEMGITAAAAMIPGGGAMVKAGARVLRAAGNTAARAGKAVAKRAKGCNSFTPDTPVMMANGLTVPISTVQSGEMVVAVDVESGEITAQPILNVIVGHGAKHLIEVETAPASQIGQFENEPFADRGSGVDTWTATAEHPIWVEGRGWVEAEALELGDQTVTASGSTRTIIGIRDFGYVEGQSVFNLSVAKEHTYIIGDVGGGTVVHNSSPLCQVTANRTAGIAFEEKVASSLRAAGFQIQRNRYYPTTMGKRYADITILRNGRPILNIEVKLGRSRHTSLQRRKDAEINRTKGVPTVVVRG